MYELQLRADANVKAYQMLHHEKLSKSSKKIIVISVIGAVHQTNFKDFSFCNVCDDNNLIVYKDDFEKDFTGWWKKLCEKLKKTGQKIQN